MPTFVPLYEVAEMPIDEHIELSTDVVSADVRLGRMSEPTRHIIADYFSGDVDEAAVYAAHLLNCLRHPPEWALEVNGAQRSGWKRW